jgi:hypothetical protein
MKIRYLLVTLATAAAIALGVQAQESSPKVPEAAKAKEDQTPLGERMEKISSAWRAIKRQITDASKNEDTLAKLATVKENMTEALKFEPALAKEKGADKAKFVADYQAGMKDEIAKIDQLIAAVKAGKNEEAAKIVGVVDQDQKDAHKQFKKQKKKQS